MMKYFFKDDKNDEDFEVQKAKSNEPTFNSLFLSLRDSYTLPQNHELWRIELKSPTPLGEVSSFYLSQQLRSGTPFILIDRKLCIESTQFKFYSPKLMILR